MAYPLVFGGSVNSAEPILLSVRLPSSMIGHGVSQNHLSRQNNELGSVLSPAEGPPPSQQVRSL